MPARKKKGTTEIGDGLGMNDAQYGMFMLDLNDTTGTITLDQSLNAQTLKLLSVTIRFATIETAISNPALYVDLSSWLGINNVLGNGLPGKLPIIPGNFSFKAGGGECLSYSRIDCRLTTEKNIPARFPYRILTHDGAVASNSEILDMHLFFEYKI